MFLTKHFITPILLVGVAGCGSRRDDAHVHGQLAAAEAAATRAVAAQQRAEAAAASIVAARSPQPEDLLLGDAADRGDEAIDDTAGSATEPEPPFG